MENDLINVGVSLPGGVSVNVSNSTPGKTSPTKTPVEVSTNGKTIAMFLSDYGKGQYKWQEWDCFVVAKTFRQYFGQKALPDFSYIYQQYNEKNFPNSKLRELFEKHCTTVTNYKDFDFVIIRKDEIDNIGTYYQGKVIYMGSRYSVTCSLSDLSGLIAKIYRLN